MTDRTVKYIVQKALRSVQQETEYLPAPDGDYDLAFNSFVDMLDEWDSKGYLLFDTVPQSINDGMSSSDPINMLVNNLIIQISELFAYEPTMRQGFKAESSLRTLRNRQSCGCPPKMTLPSRMPRGTGNYWYSRFFFASPINGCEGGEDCRCGDCCRQKDKCSSGCG